MHPMLALVAITLTFPAVFSQETLPMTVLPEDAGDTCPQNQVREDARLNISTTVRYLLSKLVPACGEGLWTKVASINMSDSSQQCPSEWREYTSIRSCGRPSNNSGCVPVTFTISDSQSQYSKVCGRAIGYQFTSTDAFGRFIAQPTGTADDNYVDGLSVTHGNNPRKHIWTFAAGLYEPNEISDPSFHRFACPCAAPNDSRFGTPPPSYVGENYFCEAGHFGPYVSNIHYSEPLWDGQGCMNSECCAFNTPPWFSVQLPSPTSDDIEVRICGDEHSSGEDATVELLEIYIQ